MPDDAPYVGAATATFIDGSARSHRDLRETVGALLDVLIATDQRPVFPAATAADLRAAVSVIDPLPDDGCRITEVLTELRSTVLGSGVRTNDPLCAAHLQPPPLLAAAAAELAIGVTNQSMDSFEQSPAATYAEDRLIARLNALLGFPRAASGVLTAGGTASNLLGLLLARDAAAPRTHDDGWPGSATRWRILTSAAAHASIGQAADVLGLGRNAVVAVGVDDAGRMDPDALDRTLAELARTGARPLAIAATAGTTDCGAIDPLDAIADRAAVHGTWLHVDAAVGSGLALSDRLRPMLAGIDRADSVTADLHKLWWQPIGASALLVRDEASFGGLREPADYLNRAEDDGVLNLVDRSLDTSRRFDALKILISLQVVGRRRLGSYVEHLVRLAREGGDAVTASPSLQLLAPPQTVTVLFRCRPAGDAGTGTDGMDLDQLNIAVQRHLLGTGKAVVGRTRVGGRVALKLTLMNPLTTADDVRSLLGLVEQAGCELAAAFGSAR